MRKSPKSAFSGRKSELMTRLAEGALSIREDPGEHDREHRDRHIFAVKGAIAHLVLPSPVTLLRTVYTRAGVELTDPQEGCKLVDIKHKKIPRRNSHAQESDREYNT